LAQNVVDTIKSLSTSPQAVKQPRESHSSWHATRRPH